MFWSLRALEYPNVFTSIYFYFMELELVYKDDLLFIHCLYYKVYYRYVVFSSYFILLDKPNAVYGEKIDSDTEGLLSGKES